MGTAAQARDVDEYYPLNVRFHDILAQITGNATLVATYRRLVNELHLYRRETLAHGPQSFPTSSHEHEAIVEAIARGDGDEAAHLLYQHAVRSRERLHRTLDRSASPTSGRAKRAAAGRNP